MRQIPRRANLDPGNLQAGGDRLLVDVGELVRRAAEVVEERDELGAERPERRAGGRCRRIAVEDNGDAPVDDSRCEAMRRVGWRLVAYGDRARTAGDGLDEAADVAPLEHRVRRSDDETRPRARVPRPPNRGGPAREGPPAR